MNKNILSRYEQELTEYWKNWKPGMGPFDKKPEDYEENVKHTKTLKKNNKIF